MADLEAKSPFGDDLPTTAGEATLVEADVGAITSVMPLAGREKETSAALEKSCGIGFPAPGRSLPAEGMRAIWSGLGQALLLGPKLGPLRGAAMTDQSDAWAALRLEGTSAKDVLARLCPLDLREEAFPEDSAARSLIGHMNAAIVRVAPEGYLILVFRSMARTAAREISEAMRSVAAQAELRNGKFPAPKG